MRTHFLDRFKTLAYKNTYLKRRQQINREDDDDDASSSD